MKYMKMIAALTAAVACVSVLNAMPVQPAGNASSIAYLSAAAADMDGKTYMAQIRQTLTNTAEPSGATAENAGTAYGTYKKETIYSDVCKRNKSFNVLIPAGYSTNKKYPVMYCMHGYWGDEDALLDKGDASLRLRQIIGNAIASGEAEDMIVVFPDIYASATQDKCSALDDFNNAAYDNFINLLTKEIMPFMEQNYSVKTGRENTAITGFSMGGRESLYIGFTRPDLFGYIGAMCPAPGVPLQNSQFTFKQEDLPYLLHVSAGSNDGLIHEIPAGYHNTMTANNTDHIWHYVQGGDHGGKTIRPHMYYFTREVFKAASTGSSTTVPADPTPVSISGGTLIQNLTVNDSDNAADWSIQKDFGRGTAIYGDRDITAVSVPATLNGAEYIRTACDSKLFTGDLASFSAGADMTVYAAVDARVNTNLDWLQTWAKTADTVKTSNDVSLELFRKTLKSGESVTLGTNGGSNESANYLIFAVAAADDYMIGDLNADGRINAVDMTLLKQILLGRASDSRIKKAADIDENGEINHDDLNQLADFLLCKIDSFTKAEPVKQESNFRYEANLQYHKAPDSYLQDCAQQGKVEKISYQTTVYQNNLTKSAQVYLPYGYDPSKQYNIFYLMHGGGGNENSIFYEDKALKPILDSMIMNGDIEPMIVVTPTFNGGSTDATANCKNFWKELATDCVPAVESKYSTYAKSTSKEDLKASRMHRAFGGFSMGSLCAWYVLLNDLDYFAYHMPLSGDCWAGNTADEKAAAVANACKKSGYAKNEYFILAATGTKDIAYSGMNPQIESMKKLTDTFTYTSDFSKGNFYYLLCDGGSHWWTGYIVHYIYDALPYFFHE